jgi:hypothetical protein
LRLRSGSRLSKWLLAAVIALGMTSSGNAMISTGGGGGGNTCVYCFDLFGWVICITTSEPIGGDIFACRL